MSSEFGRVKLTAAVSLWNDIHLESHAISALSRLKFTSPTPIQSRAIPLIKDGFDVIGKAPTGSGKTLAFGIPIYEHCLNSKHKHGKAHPQKMSAIILSPTRELAHQLSQHLMDLSQSDMSVATITGGLSLQKQQRLLSDADVVVATPGRLWEMLSGNKDLVDRLQNARFLVLDEADRLLSEGHFKEVEEILSALDKTADEDGDERQQEAHLNRQTLVFSATFQKDLQRKLAGKGNFSEMLGKADSMEYLLRKINFKDRPKFVDINPVSQMASNLKEYMVECAALEKVCHHSCKHVQMSNCLTGFVPLLSPTFTPRKTNTCVFEQHCICTALDTIPAKPTGQSPGDTQSNASENPTSLH